MSPYIFYTLFPISFRVSRKSKKSKGGGERLINRRDATWPPTHSRILDPLFERKIKKSKRSPQSIKTYGDFVDEASFNRYSRVELVDRRQTAL